MELFQEAVTLSGIDLVRADKNIFSVEKIGTKLWM